MKKLFLLDGMALAYRAHFALIRSPIYNSKGMNTSAIFGFTATLIDLIKKQQPTHLAIAFDTSAPTERHRLHPEYKANRDAMPEDLSLALPYIETVSNAFNIPILKQDGFEADDIMTLAKTQNPMALMKSTWSSDKDFGQLVTEKIKMYRPSRQGDGAEIWGIPEILEKWDISEPKQVIDMLGLCGDVSDNIPGVPGIGPKTASKLIHNYSNIEQLLETYRRFKGKQKEQLEQYSEQALLSKKLAIINQSVPIEYDWDAFALNEPAKERLEALFSELEFRTLGKRLFGSDFQIKSPSRELHLELGRNKNKTEIELVPGNSLQSLSDITTDYRLIRNDLDKEDLLKASKKLSVSLLILRPIHSTP